MLTLQCHVHSNHFAPRTPESKLSPIRSPCEHSLTIQGEVSVFGSVFSETKSASGGTPETIRIGTWSSGSQYSTSPLLQHYEKKTTKEVFTKRNQKITEGKIIIGMAGSLARVFESSRKVSHLYCSIYGDNPFCSTSFPSFHSWFHA